MTSFAKYNPVSAKSRVLNHGRHSGNSLSDNTRPYFHPRRRIRKGFFIKPHIHIERELVKHNQKVAVKSEEFDVIIWMLKIENRFGRISQIVNNCYAKMYLDLLGKEINLVWKTAIPERSAVHIPISSSEYTKDGLRDAYIDRLGLSYTDLLISHHSLDSISIPPTESGQLYFVVTHQGSDFAFLMTNDENRTIEWHQYGEKKVLAYKENTVFLMLQKDKEYRIHLRFEGDGYYEQKGKVLKVKMKSWDDIELK